MSAALEWIDAETPHAKVPRSHGASGPSALADDADVQDAVDRIEQFQARRRTEVQERPLVLVETF